MKKILVANRGEIAVRVIRACRERGLATVAVYSEPDRGALHVRLADEARPIGPASPLESYLNVDAIIAAARETGADAIHPGYGFLAENAAFAARCEQEELVFVGPPADVIETMGDKVAARARMKAAGIPLIPGTEGSSTDLDRVVTEAGKIPLPVMVKAAGGGGGKGMRIVRKASELKDAVQAASREAQSAFGDGTVYAESYLEEPRHVEVQILADHHGHVVHLFERECSIQRRHQKLVEETPSPAVDEPLRTRMGETAVRVAEAIGYRNAGTVEFLLVPGGEFYFLEVNTRIQVEHPITELVTGLDLVAWQLRVAAGEKLAFSQSDLTQRGHAIECRIYAEDPAHGFLPSTGTILHLDEPHGPGVRVDSGVYEGWTVTPDYDPILAKVVTWGEDREAARHRMRAALAHTLHLGIRTTAAYLRDVLDHEAFVKGETYTDFLDRHLAGWSDRDGLPDEVLIAAALIEVEAPRRAAAARGDEVAPSPWHTVGGWRLGGG